MRFAGSLLLGVMLSCALSGMATAAERKGCLSPAERQAVVVGPAVPLAKAMRVVKAKLGGEVVKARLCRQERGFVYVLTVLARDGKVTQARVDAADGRWLDGG